MYRKILVAGATAAAIVGAGTAALATTGNDVTAGTPVAAAATSSHPGPAATHHGKHKGHRRADALLRRAAYGSVVVKTKKGYVTIDFAKGSVATASSGSITVQEGDNTTQTFTVTAATKVRARTAGTKGKGTTSSISKVASGDRVVVFGTGSTTKTATRIVDLGKK